MSVTPIRDVRALDAQDLKRCILELADVLDGPGWRNEPLTGGVVAAALRKAATPGSKRGSQLSQAMRYVIRRTLRHGGRRVAFAYSDAEESHT
jgi:hypothetical protein